MMQALAAADDEHNVVERRDAEVKLPPTSYSANHGGSNANGGASDRNTNTTINTNSGGVASRRGCSLPSHSLRGNYDSAAKAQASKKSAAKKLKRALFGAHFNPIQIQFIQILMHTTAAAPAPAPTSASMPLTLVSDLAEVEVVRVSPSP
jgi:hypothetical protein